MKIKDMKKQRNQKVKEKEELEEEIAFMDKLIRIFEKRLKKVRRLYDDRRARTDQFGCQA